MADSPTSRPSIFISYSHRDRRYLERVQRFLRLLGVRGGAITVWDNTQIKPGDVWQREIERALESAQAVILLVSADFLASGFVAKEEVPRLLTAAQKRGVLILPVILSPCSFRTSPLGSFQAINDPDRPLIAMSEDEQDRIWLRVLEALMERLALRYEQSVRLYVPLDVPDDILLRASMTPPAPEEVQFTAFYPKEVAAETWHTMLVYTHIASALRHVRADALKFKSEMGGSQRRSFSRARSLLARGTELTIVPSGEGIAFNPPSLSLKWVEDWQRVDFRLQASKSLAGLDATGEITIYAGMLIIATIKFAFLVEEGPILVSEPAPTAEATSTLYQRIFASYSHKDTAVVLACRNAYRALGNEILRDFDTLRSGQAWSEELLRMIDRADIFQLFWSAHSARSRYVRREWQYALEKNNSVGFIRPVYWEEPLVKPPRALAHLHFAYVPLPQLEEARAPVTRTNIKKR